MSQKWAAVCMIFIGTMVLLLPQAIPANAQEPTPGNDANCVACHEHQYYLYDSGKWFCLCDAPMHCMYCHGGRNDSPVEDIAHQGLVLYPTRNHAERCQACHTEDYMSRVVTFETVAGVSSTPLPIITATPINLAAALVEGLPSNPLMLRLSQLESWRLIALSMITILLVGILFFGYRCWRADCLTKRKP
jgi:hypothetical protein